MAALANNPIGAPAGQVDFSWKPMVQPQGYNTYVSRSPSYATYTAASSVQSNS